MLLALGFGFIWYQLIAHLGISAGLHRYFAHRQFKMPVALEWFILYMCVIAGARSPIGWISAHRMHHDFSDEKNDPHSPVVIGFFRSLFSLWRIQNIPPRYSRDLFLNARLRFFHVYWKYIWFFSALAALLVGLNFFIGFIVVPGVLSYLGFGLVNAGCHLSGEANNLPWINLLVAGEGYHLQHHENGGQICLHKYDTTGRFLLFLLKTGFITR